MKNRKKTDIPNIGAPATRALDREGITSLAKLKKYTQAHILSLHGVGPKAIRILQKALKKKGSSFKK